MSNSIIGLLDGDGLDGIYHVIDLALLGFDPWYPLCSEIDVAMSLLCLMLVTRARVLPIMCYDPLTQSDNNRDTYR